MESKQKIWYKTTFPHIRLKNQDSTVVSKETKDVYNLHQPAEQAELSVEQWATVQKSKQLNLEFLRPQITCRYYSALWIYISTMQPEADCSTEVLSRWLRLLTVHLLRFGVWNSVGTPALGLGANLKRMQHKFGGVSWVWKLEKGTGCAKT